MSKDFIREVLIHEMIHLWQDSHVSEKRYKMCSWNVAHDRVFTSKMNTINLILERNLYDIKIDTVCKKELKLDPSCNADKDFYVVFAEDFGGHHMYLKVLPRYKKKVISQIIDKNKSDNPFFKNVFVIKTNSYRYNLMKPAKEFFGYFSSDKDNLYESSINDNPTWVIKDEKLVK